MQFRRMLAMINFISLTIRCLSTPFIFYCTIFSFDNYPISGRQTRICAHNLMDCIRFAKIPNDSSDPSDSTMKKHREYDTRFTLEKVRSILLT